MTTIDMAVGWSLIHSLWQGALAAAALWAVLMATRSPRIRYAAACFAMVLMVCGFGWTLLRMLPERANTTRPAPPVIPLWIVTAAAGSSLPSSVDFAQVVPWLAPCWMTGVGLFYLWHLASWISVSRLRHRGVCVASEHWRNRLTRLSTDLRLSKPVQLLESAIVDAPMVLGHLRPVILMPAGLLAGLPIAHVEAILLHELAHIRRHDYLTNVVQRLVEGLMFYHPAAWWISSVMRTERENCCDDMAVAVSGSAHEYAAALAQFEESRHTFREPAMAATGGSLVKRINRLLNPRGPRGTGMPLLAAIILMVTATAGLTAWQQTGTNSKTPPEGVAGILYAEDSPYQKWMDEDVVYIMAEEERTAFRKLATDDERKQFIEQFWERRNPTPAAAANTFKEEHYRRIAYANEHFASSVAGWKTDRGRMYIVYGPPDEKDAHPSVGSPLYPREIWKYIHIDGIGDNLTFMFIDRNRNGQFVLAPANSQ